jgi:hypothetical protein
MTVHVRRATWKRVALCPLEFPLDTLKTQQNSSRRATGIYIGIKPPWMPAQRFLWCAGTSLALTSFRARCDRSLKAREPFS